MGTTKVNANLPARKRLQEFSVAELERELEERKRPKVGQPLEKPDFAKLQQAVIDSVNETIENRCEDEDAEHFIYEAAMEAVYGKDVWNWYNKLLR